MARPRLHHPQDLIAQLPAGQPQPAGVLAERLGINRMALSRLVAAAPQVVRIGNTRATAYALRQATRAGSEWPLYRLREDATLEELGQVVALSGETFHVQVGHERPNLRRPPDGAFNAFFPGLPWYLDDLRPQGFLGRTFAHGMGQRLGVPVDLNRWQQDDVLMALVNAGGTEAGDLLLGGAAVERALTGLQQPADHVLAAQRLQAYPLRAEAVLQGEDVGSSPGGEQPKFTATVESNDGRRAVLVKFARIDAGDAAQRWSDLLVCEHLALEVLAAAGIPAARSSILRSGAYTFLEVERFDRTADVLGRRGFVSMLALVSAFTGEADADWVAAAASLQASGWLDAHCVERIAGIHAFGRLIGNTDMHQGNIGFHLLDQGTLPLAPVYDMLPMSLAPSRLGVVRADQPLALVVPRGAGELQHLRWAAPLAMTFWQRVAGESAIQSEVLRQLAGINADRVATMSRHFG